MARDSRGGLKEPVGRVAAAHARAVAAESPAHDFDLFVMYAAADADFVRGYLLRPFTANEASWFFGRDKEIDDLIGRLDRGEREIYVIGPSGSGKSSLVQAGLVPALDAGSSRLGRSFVVRAMRPGARPTDRLARALEADLATPAAAIGALVARHPLAERVLVFVDQLEELFTLADAAERQRFVAALRALHAEPRCHVLLALRADSTARGWSRRALITRRGSGTPGRACRWLRRSSIRIPSTLRRSAPTGRGWSPRATTTPRGCGTQPRGGR